MDRGLPWLAEPRYSTEVYCFLNLTETEKLKVLSSFQNQALYLWEDNENVLEYFRQKQPDIEALVDRSRDIGRC